MAETSGVPNPVADNRPGPRFEVDVFAQEGHLKEGKLTQYGSEFTVRCDEGPQLGGANTAPTPLAYFTLAMGF